VSSTARTRGTSCVRNKSVLPSAARTAKNGSAHFLAEIFKGVRQSMADGKSQLAQTKCLQKRHHLVPHAHGAVLQIAIIEAQPWINQDFLHPVFLGQVRQTGKIIPHPPDDVPAQIEVPDFSHIEASHETEDDGRFMCRRHAEYFSRLLRAGQVDHFGARLQAGSRDLRLISFD